MTLIARGATPKGWPVETRGRTGFAKVRPWPSIRVCRDYTSRRWVLSFAWLFVWRGHCVFHLYDSWYLPSFERCRR